MKLKSFLKKILDNRKANIGDVLLRFIAMPFVVHMLLVATKDPLLVKGCFIILSLNLAYVSFILFSGILKKDLPALKQDALAQISNGEYAINPNFFYLFRFVLGLALQIWVFTTWGG